jgi:hypothetical protein
MSDKVQAGLLTAEGSALQTLQFATVFSSENPRDNKQAIHEKANGL